MDGMAKHKQETASPSKADIWFVLILTGGASAFLQMWHATHSGSTAGIVDGIVGLVPAATAVGLSHVVVSHKAEAWLRVVTVGVMLAFMAAAASASAAVVQPVEVRAFNWVFAIALDAAELGCVWVLLGNHERKAAEAAALSLAGKEAETARAEAAEAAGNLAAREAELAAAHERIEALMSAAPSPPAKRPRKPSKSADTQDLTAELRAMQMLDAHPELKQKGQAGELARRLGISPSHGRRLHSRLTAEERPSDPPMPGAHEHPSGPANERSPEHTEGRP
jgi:hypothetical protein